MMKTRNIYTRRESNNKEAIGKLMRRFLAEEAYCLSEDACFVKNTSAKIISAENKDREKDVMFSTFS